MLCIIWSLIPEAECVWKLPIFVWPDSFSLWIIYHNPVGYVVQWDQMVLFFIALLLSFCHYQLWAPLLVCSIFVKWLSMKNITCMCLGIYTSTWYISCIIQHDYNEYFLLYNLYFVNDHICLGTYGYIPLVCAVFAPHNPYNGDKHVVYY